MEQGSAKRDIGGQELREGMTRGFETTEEEIVREMSASTAQKPLNKK